MQRGRRDGETPGLDLREIEDVVDDREQRAAGTADHVDVFQLSLRQIGFSEQVGDSHDAVHWRADLV